MSDIVKIENLDLFYDDHHVLRNVNLSLIEGGITSIIGPSGCGKSTLLKCINNIIKENVTSKVTGSITFMDESIYSLPSDILRKNIGMVFQNPLCFPMSIRGNMEYALKYFGVSKGDRKAIVDDTLKVTGLYSEVSSVMNKSALKLSGGQQQRMCIARALTVKPKILLLDEPCSALDVKSTKIIEDLLLSLKDEYTILIVTHNLQQARRISDHVIFMNDGRVVESGSCEKIFTACDNPLTVDYLGGNFG